MLSSSSIMRVAEYNQKSQVLGADKIKEVQGTISYLRQSTNQIKDFDNSINELKGVLGGLRDKSSARLMAESQIPGTEAYKAKALYDQVLTGTSFTTMSTAKQAGAVS